MLAFAGFTAFLVLRLQEGFERRASEWFGAAEEVPAEREEVVSTAVEFTRFDERGRLVLQGRAEQALGRSDGQQRFLEVEVRLVDVYDDGDALVAADELLLDPQAEAVEFIGNALLRVEGLELSGPHLHFRRAPDRLWTRDPVQFQSGDFVGIAASMQFETDTGDVSLQGVVAVPVAEEGFRVIAERVRFEGETSDTSLFGDVQITSDQFELVSQESVIARRDRERHRMRSLEGGFGTALTLLDAGGEEGAIGPDGTGEDVLVLHGDSLEISLEEGRIPRRVTVAENPALRKGSITELQGDEAAFALDSEGSPERVTMTGKVAARLPGGPGQRSLVQVDSSGLEVDFEPQGEIREARFEGKVRARYGQASATATRARWDGVDTLVLEGGPRVVDASLLELESSDLRLVLAEPGRIEAADAVTARFLPARLDWLPGRFESVVLTGDSALIETGSGRGAFAGSVRLLFGANRLRANDVRIDADTRTIEAKGEVVTSLGLEVPARGTDGEDGLEDVERVPASAASAEPGAAAVNTVGPDSDESAAASEFVFTVRSERFRYDAAGGNFSFRGSPGLERESASGEISTLVAGRIEAELTPDGSLGALRGVQGARFERGNSLVRGSRVRYDPAADILLAWGSPAVVRVEGRTSEGGLLELALAENRTEIHPTHRRRAFTRARILREDGGPHR